MGEQSTKKYSSKRESYEKKKKKILFQGKIFWKKKITHWPKKIHLSLHGLKITFKQGKC